MFVGPSKGMTVGARLCWTAVVAVVALTGCASGPTATGVDAASPQASCRRWFADLAALVTQHQVNDAQERAITGFPQLRQSRFAASFKGRAAQSEAAFGAWFQQLRALGDQAQRVETANLPASALRVLWPLDDGPEARAKTLARTLACADALDDQDRADPARRALLLADPGVPDDYSTLARFAGLYAFTRWPFSAGVHRWQSTTKEAFGEPASAPSTPLARYVPAVSALQDVSGPLARAPRDALGIPQLDEALIRQLLDQHAPIIELTPQGPFDRMGELHLDADGLPHVNAAKPTVYRRLAFTRQGAATLVQLVYLFWFSERPKTGPLDLLGGALDGVIWRVTLDESGQPLVYDSIHACGCYHLFFPTPALQARPAPEPGIEWAFVPAPAPHLGPGERVVLGVASATHYLNAVSATSDFNGTSYQDADESGLRSLAVAGGGGTVRRSLYAPDGTVDGTQRGERYFFWPMGVRDAGAQRQWGRHATAFVGRRHFDDADLMERRFKRVTESFGPDPVPNGQQRP
jgi:hypothetical protein